MLCFYISKFLPISFIFLIRNRKPSEALDLCKSISRTLQIVPSKIQAFLEFFKYSLLKKLTILITFNLLIIII